MNITFVVSGLGTGGAEFALRRLCSALTRHGARSRVISLRDEGDIGPLLRDDGIPLHALHLESPMAWTSVRREIALFDKGNKPDVVQGWMYHGNLAALYLAPRRTPVAWGVRQSLLANRDKLATRLVIRTSAALSRRATAIVYNSVAGRSQHEAIGFSPDRASVIPNGFDLDEFRFDEVAREKMRLAVGLGAGHILVGHVARFHASKDHATFLRAFALVARTHPQVRAVLAGDGVDTQNAALTSLLTKLGITDRVSLLGRRSNIASLMSAFDVFCSSSNGMEGFPNVVAEAMSCEVPCVVTDVGDARSVTGACGEVVQPADERSLAAALERLISIPDPARRALGRAAREHIANHFSIDSVAKQYLRLYESLVAGRQPSSCAA